MSFSGLFFRPKTTWSCFLLMLCLALFSSAFNVHLKRQTTKKETNVIHSLKMVGVVPGVPHHHTLKTKIQETLFVQLQGAIKKTVLSSSVVTFFSQYWILLPIVLRQILKAMHPADFFFFVGFNFLYKKSLRLLHRIQSWVFKM